MTYHIMNTDTYRYSTLNYHDVTYIPNLTMSTAMCLLINKWAVSFSFKQNNFFSKFHLILCTYIKAKMFLFVIFPALYLQERDVASW